MIKIMTIGEPIFKIKYFEKEKDMKIDQLGILINLSIDEKKDIMIEGIPLHPLKGTIVGHVTIPEIDAAVLIENYEEVSNDPNLFDKISKSWPLMYNLRPEERFKGLPFYHAVGDNELTSRINIYLDCIAAPRRLGLHKNHPRNIDEYHCQIVGCGSMKKFHENDYSTMYQELYMAPGIVHDTIFNAQGEYPWHQYESYTRAVFMGIHIAR
jgi:hypothetical protein